MEKKNYKLNWKWRNWSYHNDSHCPRYNRAKKAMMVNTAAQWLYGGLWCYVERTCVRISSRLYIAYICCAANDRASSNMFADFDIVLRGRAIRMRELRFVWRRNCCTVVESERKYTVQRYAINFARSSSTGLVAI